MKLIDVRCEPSNGISTSCGKVINDVFDDEMVGQPCECGGIYRRMYSARIFKEFVPRFYENFEHEPIYIETREQFKEECDKRNLYQKGGDGCYDIRLTPKRHPTELVVPVKKKRTQAVTPEKAVIDAYEKLNIE